MNRDEFIINRVKSLLANEKKGRLIDIGPGKGKLTDELARMGFNVDICDYDAKIVKALSRYKGQQCDVNSEKLPYEDESFDIVNCTEVLEHIENPWHVVREIKRILRKGGIVIFSTPHVDSFVQKLKYLFCDELFSFSQEQVKEVGGHITPIHDFVFENILKRNNFEIVKKTYALGWVPILRLKLAPSKAFGDTLIIKARKK